MRCTAALIVLNLGFVVLFGRHSVIADHDPPPDPGTPPPTDKLTIYIEGTGQVTVSDAPCGSGNHTVNDTEGYHTYDYSDCSSGDKEVSLSASTRAGYPDWTFSHWELDVTGSTVNENLTVSGYKRVRAVFVPPDPDEDWDEWVTLTTSVTGQAQTAGCTVSPDGESHHPKGATIPLKPENAEDWYFSSWSGPDGADVESWGSEHSINMDEDKEIEATFVAGYTVVVRQDGAGSVTLSPAGGFYTGGTDVTLTTSPGTGGIDWSFVEWDSSFDVPTDIGDDQYQFANLSEDKHAKAIFEKSGGSTLTVHTRNGLRVAVDPTPDGYNGENPLTEGTEVLDYGSSTSVTLESEPLEFMDGLGYTFEYWLGDVPAQADPTDNPLTITVDSNKSLMAISSQVVRLHVIVVSENSGDAVDVSASPSSLIINIDGDTYDIVRGAEITLDAVPAQGSSFVRWRGSVRGNTEPTNVTAQRSMWIYARFTGGTWQACGDDRDILREMYPTYGYSPAPACGDLVDEASYVNPGNFSFSDLDCDHDEPVGEHEYQWDNTVSSTFQEIRDEHGAAIVVTSAFRCPIHNNSVSQVGSGSQHAYGNAFDFDNGDATENWAVAISASAVVDNSDIRLYESPGGASMRYSDLLAGSFDDTNLPTEPFDWTTYSNGHVNTD
jgi:hypothetical protein